MRAQYSRSYSYQPVSQSEPVEEEVNPSESLDYKRRDSSFVLTRARSEPFFDTDLSHDNRMETQGRYDEPCPESSGVEGDLSNIQLQETGSEPGFRQRRCFQCRRRCSKNMINVASFLILLLFWGFYFGYGFKPIRDLGVSDVGVPKVQHLKASESHENRIEIGGANFVSMETQKTTVKSVVKETQEPSGCYLEHNEVGYGNDVKDFVYTENECAVYQSADKKETGVPDVECPTSSNVGKRHLKVECMCTKRTDQCILKILEKFLGECDKDSVEICRHGGKQTWIRGRLSGFDEITCDCRDTGYTGRFCHIPETLVCSRCPDKEDCGTKLQCSDSRRKAHYPCLYADNSTSWSCKPHDGSQDDLDLGSMRSCKDIKMSTAVTTESTSVITTTSPVVMTAKKTRTGSTQAPCSDQLRSRAQVMRVEREMISHEWTATLHYIGGFCQLALLVSFFALNCCLLDKCSSVKRVTRKSCLLSWIVEKLIMVQILVSFGVPCFEFGVKFQFFDNLDYVAMAAAFVTPLALSFLHQPQNSTTKCRNKDIEEEHELEERIGLNSSSSPV